MRVVASLELVCMGLLAADALEFFYDELVVVFVGLEVDGFEDFLCLCVFGASVDGAGDVGVFGDVEDSGEFFFVDAAFDGADGGGCFAVGGGDFEAVEVVAVGCLAGVDAVPGFFHVFLSVWYGVKDILKSSRYCEI